MSRASMTGRDDHPNGMEGCPGGGKQQWHNHSSVSNYAKFLHSTAVMKIPAASPEARWMRKVDETKLFQTKQC